MLTLLLSALALGPAATATACVDSPHLSKDELAVQLSNSTRAREIGCSLGPPPPTHVRDLVIHPRVVLALIVVARDAKHNGWRNGAVHALCQAAVHIALSVSPFSEQVFWYLLLVFDITLRLFVLGVSWSMAMAVALVFYVSLSFLGRVVARGVLVLNRVVRVA